MEKIRPAYQMNIMMPIRYRSLMELLSDTGTWSQAQVLCAGLHALNNLSQKDRSKILLTVMGQVRADHNDILAGKKVTL